MDKKKQTVIKTTVEEETGISFRKLSKQRGLSEAMLLRILILAALNEGQERAELAKPADDGQLQKSRHTIRIPTFLFNAVKGRADQKGMTAVKWITSLIQSNLTHNPVMTEKEIMTLQASLRELIAVGRNLNQIARALNLEYEKPTNILAILTKLKGQITRHRLTIRSLVKASRNNWSAD